MPHTSPSTSDGMTGICERPLLYSAENLSLYHAWEKPMQGEEHAHSDLQIGLPLSGTYHAAWQTETGQRRQRVVTPDALVLCTPYQPHTIRVSRETELAVVWLPATFLAHAAEGTLAPESTKVIGSGTKTDPLLRQLCLALLTEVRQNGSPMRLYIDTMSTALAAHLLRRHATTHRTERNTSGGLPPGRLKRVLAYVQDHLDQDVSLADLTGLADMSESRFCVLFRRSTGLSPYQYVLTQRIERAKQLLLTGQVSVGEVASAVGFCDQSQFTRRFKRQVGVTPGAFLKSRR